MGNNDFDSLYNLENNIQDFINDIKRFHDKNFYPIVFNINGNIHFCDGDLLSSDIPCFKLKQNKIFPNEYDLVLFNDKYESKYKKYIPLFEKVDYRIIEELYLCDYLFYDYNSSSGYFLMEEYEEDICNDFKNNILCISKIKKDKEYIKKFVHLSCIYDLYDNFDESVTNDFEIIKFFINEHLDISIMKKDGLGSSVPWNYKIMKILENSNYDRNVFIDLLENDIWQIIYMRFSIYSLTDDIFQNDLKEKLNIYSDKEIIYLILSHNSKLYDYIKKLDINVYHDKEFVNKIIKLNKTIVKYLPEEYKGSYDSNDSEQISLF